MRIPAAIALFFLWMPDASALELAVIVNAEHPSDGLSLQDCRQAFLKQFETWPTGVPLRPADYLGEDMLRAVFLRKVVRYSDLELAQYWTQRRYVEGVATPARFETQADVIEYVAAHEGAIGYVHASAVVGAIGVKVVAVTSDP